MKIHIHTNRKLKHSKSNAHYGFNYIKIAVGVSDPELMIPRMVWGRLIDISDAEGKPLWVKIWRTFCAGEGVKFLSHTEIPRGGPDP